MNTQVRGINRKDLQRNLPQNILLSNDYEDIANRGYNLKVFYKVYSLTSLNNKKSQVFEGLVTKQPKLLKTCTSEQQALEFVYEKDKSSVITNTQAMAMVVNRSFCGIKPVKAEPCKHLVRLAEDAPYRIIKKHKVLRTKIDYNKQNSVITGKRCSEKGIAYQNAVKALRDKGFSQKQAKALVIAQQAIEDAKRLEFIKKTSFILEKPKEYEELVKSTVMMPYQVQGGKITTDNVYTSCAPREKRTIKRVAYQAPERINYMENKRFPRILDTFFNQYDKIAQELAGRALQAHLMETREVLISHGLVDEKTGKLVNSHH